MEWSQFVLLLVTLTGLFVWNRTESRADYRHLESGVSAQIEAIRQDIKDFHGRLCSIEERKKRGEKND